jgi:DNA polymerase III gamma/tau subunit
MSSKEQKYILSIANLVSEGLIDPETARKLSRLTPAYELIAFLIDMLSFDTQTVQSFTARILERES